MSEEEKKAMQYFYNIRATIDESNMLFDEDINVKCGKETVKQITTILNLIQSKQKEIKKKDKIIDKVYDFIWENDCCRYFSKKHTLCNQVLNFDSCLGNCKRNCIKQYFEKKVEDK